MTELEEESVLDFMAVVESSGLDAMGDVDRRTELFNIIAAEFSTNLGKVGSNFITFFINGASYFCLANAGTKSPFL